MNAKINRKVIKKRVARKIAFVQYPSRPNFMLQKIEKEKIFLDLECLLNDVAGFGVDSGGRRRVGVDEAGPGIEIGVW